MTLHDYILNPMGKSNAVLNAAVRELTKAQYTKRFDNILLRENGKIEYYLFEYSKNNTYWAYFKIPSEVVHNFYYDVVFKFIPNQSTGSSGDLFKYDAKFFSNDPAFVYTYAHVFRKNSLFIDELSSKMSKEALKKAPKEKNPSEVVGYVKAIYFAYLVMQNRSLNKLFRFKAESKPLDPQFLLDNIQAADEKIADRQEQGAKVSKRKKIEVSENQLKKIQKIVGNDGLQNSNLVVRSEKVKPIKAIKQKGPTKAVKHSSGFNKK